MKREEYDAQTREIRDRYRERGIKCRALIKQFNDLNQAFGFYFQIDYFADNLGAEAAKAHKINIEYKDTENVLRNKFKEMQIPSNISIDYNISLPIGLSMSRSDIEEFVTPEALQKLLQESLPGTSIEPEKIDALTEALHNVLYSKIASHLLFEEQAEKRKVMRQEFQNILAKISKDSCELLDLKQAYKDENALSNRDLKKDMLTKEIDKGIEALKQQYHSVVEETGVTAIINKDSSFYQLLMSNSNSKISFFLHKVSKMLNSVEERQALQVEKIIENIPPELLTKIHSVQTQIEKDTVDNNSNMLKKFFGVKQNAYKFQNLVGMEIKDLQLQKAVEEIKKIILPIFTEDLSKEQGVTKEGLRESIGNFTKNLNKKAELTEGKINGK
ncbi:hypothetical protein NF27_EY01770 [Candidatus Jidaibacter acanthamoeba]|uniref:Uncharacterized protein n=1 Tax=Candidatus Jidaibacter acanthamoebae TaxID=86105 RepID=A0A0C1MYR9_9RICK|nr:hypothetical protein [Candidatus Jidaibacter acanthamoeba]KIE05081.1 hypothetical protein NF27_EY01770 [Candidatus Jidaibacter acanthamoeba]